MKFDIKTLKFWKDNLVNHSSVGGIVYDDSKRVCMLFHKNMNRWTIPVGHIDKGERPGDALDRELEEEIGIKVISKKKIIVKKMKFFFNSKEIEIAMHIYEIEDYKGTPKNKEPHQHKIMKFFTVSELINMPREDISEFTWLWLYNLKGNFNMKF